MFKHNLRTEVTIAAPPEAVISLLCNGSDYSWNQFLCSLKVTGGPSGAGGDVVEGSTLAIELDVKQSGKMMNIAPVVLTKTPTELRWVGTLGGKAVFRGEHFYIAKQGASPNETVLEHGEDFSGLLVGVFKLTGMMEDTRKAFENLNAGLKNHFSEGKSGE